MQPLQIKPMKVELKKPFVEAMEVTGNLIHSLPNAGAVMQKFGSEQVEILMPGANQQKRYAILGEYILRFMDENGKENYAIVSGMAFKSLFTAYSGPDVAETEPETDESVEASGDPLEEEVSDVVTEAPVEDAKVDRRKKRTKELLEGNLDAMEVPLSADAIDVGDEQNETSK